MIADTLILIIALAPALAVAGLIGCAIAYRPLADTPPQCPVHEDCDVPAACTAVLLAEAAAAGHPHGFDTTGGVA